MRSRSRARSSRVNLQSNGSASVVVAVLEGGKAVGDLVEVEKVVGVDDFALDDGEDDLDLVQPGGVDRQVDEPQVGPGAFETVDRCLAPVASCRCRPPRTPGGPRRRARRS